MDTKRFDRTVADLAGSLGDPTRRGIYVTARESSEPVTAVEIAEAFQIHPNVARHHLDRLAADGYLRISRRRQTEKRGPGAGRPAKYYEATDKEIAVQFPPRRHDLLAELLVRVVERASPEHGPTIAEEVGREYGRQIAAEIGMPEEEGFPAAVKAVAAAMIGVGFEMSADPSHRQLLTYHCPFGETATNHPEVVCKLDQGIVKGMMEMVRQDPEPVVVTPHQKPDGICLTDI